MIERIVLDGVACFKEPAVLETAKRINLVYGLNGTGKSTLTNFLYDPSNPVFSRCSASKDPAEAVLVYNQSFVRDYFYQVQELPGIFTLSKENKEAEQRIRTADQSILRLEEVRKEKSDAIDREKEKLISIKQTAENRTWDIKTSYSGGDRVLEYCLAGLMGRKEALFNYLLSFQKPPTRPGKSVDRLKKEAEEISEGNDEKTALLPELSFSGQSTESNPLFRKSILGNEGSRLADRITKLSNADWVRKGLEYLPAEIEHDAGRCPFCQESTITKTLTEELRNYFNDEYESAITGLRDVSATYAAAIRKLTPKETYALNRFVRERSDEFERLHSAIAVRLGDNENKIASKLVTPSQVELLSSSVAEIEAFNGFVRRVNEAIAAYNAKIADLGGTQQRIKTDFWSIMRWEYDQTISTYLTETAKANSTIEKLEDGVSTINREIEEQKKEIELQQKRTVNIDEAVSRINSGLIELGIDGFHVERHSDVLYRIARTEECANTFQTLSEGEKMIISFLYFRERCRGKRDASDTTHKKTVVIDDPISSLSHIYVFNIGQMIKNDFFDSSDYEQIIVLTHSLYFFYELTDTNHGRRKENQKLFRITKSSRGSNISEMGYEEIQNDYQSYWHIVADECQPVALIANCMRNIVEYFFNFIEKRDVQ